MSDPSEFKGKTFQAAQLTHERFLTIDHSFKTFFLISVKPTLQMFAGIYGGFIGKSECGDFKFMGKTFQAAQLTHERFLTIERSCKIFF